MKKKTYADLFKPQKNVGPIVEEQGSVLGISENGSCSSGLSTPFGSELGSSGTSGSEDEEFMEELSRQMAECMLIEEEEKDHAEDSTSSVCQGSEVYQLKNQPQESGIGESRATGSRRVPNTGRNYVNYRRNGQGIGGSGMKAIFLDNSGSSYGSCGTGVFLPRFPNDPTPEKKKPVCSTVLMPMRVLQTLELHFSRLSDSSSSVSHGAGPRCTDHDTPWTHPGLKDTRNGLLSPPNDDPRFQSHPEHEEEEMRLPQEWTY